MTKMICPIMSAARMANSGADFRHELISRHPLTPLNTIVYGNEDKR